MALQIEKVYENNPILRRDSRLSSKITTTEDKSSMNAWCGELSTENIRLVTVWHLGRRKAEATLSKIGYNENHFETKQDVTMMKPFGNILNDDPELDDEFQISLENNQQLQDNLEDVDNDINIQDSMDPPCTDKKHPMYVQIETGLFVHKANAVNSVVNKKSKTSKDRLKRVQPGIIKLNEDLQSDELEDSFFRINDTVLGYAKIKGYETLLGVIVVVQKIIHDSVALSSIDIEDLKIAELHGSILKIIDGENNTLEWTSEYGDTLKLEGRYCIQISSNIDNNGRLFFKEKNLAESLEVLKLFESKNSDFFSSLKPVENPFHTNKISKFFEISVNIEKLSDKIECFFCPKQLVKRKTMRLHIGIHMMLKLIPINPTTCGFCGIMGCSISLETNCAGKNAPKCPVSNCKFAEKFSLKAAEKSTKNSPCTNRPVICGICKLIVWSYNIKIHFERIHIGYEVPDMISEEEIIRMKKLEI